MTILTTPLLIRAVVLSVFIVQLIMTSVVPNTVNAADDISMNGNIGVYSKYVLRGIHASGGESAGPVVQGGFNLSYSNGFYVGYWGSSLGYADEAGEAGYENDLYTGYSGEVNGFSYNAGVMYYKYLQISNSDAPEFVVSVGYGPVSVAVYYLLQDVVWGNTGDTYLTLNYAAGLPKEFSLSLSYVYYFYQDNGKYISSSEVGAGFRHLNLTLSHAIGKTGANMSIAGIYGGVDRYDTDQGVTTVMGISYVFDI